MADKLKLTVACGDYMSVGALKDGTVRADGLDLVMLTGMGSRERHWRLARKLEFDVCEMNVGAYFMARDRGAPLTAIPVFLHRRFRHGFVFVNTRAGIQTPRDLIGKRVGGTNYQPAGNLWIRGILEEHYDVPHQSMTWVVERSEDVEFDPSPGLRIEMIAPGQSLDQMLAEGELPAMISPSIPKPIIEGDPRVARLWPNYKDIELAYYQQTSIFPIMHVTVVKQEIVDQYPWVPTELVKAFEQAKQAAYKRTANPRVVPLAWVRTAWEEERATLGPDPWEYGLTDRNRHNLETIIRYVHQQGLTSRAMSLDELFVDTDLGDSGGAEENV
jgi:4,5-dihydroxyphthalate decarboxylase